MPVVSLGKHRHPLELKKTWQREGFGKGKLREIEECIYIYVYVYIYIFDHRLNTRKILYLI